jgi:CelD/BcsL family acetyltransferase involved in cellulose biosynthesis
VFDVKVENSFDFSSREYADLFVRSGATAFQHPYWLERLYTKLVPCQNAEPLVVTVRSTVDRTLAMVLPLVRRRHGGLRVVEFADLHVSDYNALVSSPSSIAEILQNKFVTRAIRHALLPYDLLRVQKLTDGAMAVGTLFGAGPCLPMPMSAHAVPLQLPFEQWRTDHMDGSYRKELDKKERQLRRRGAVRFECLTDPAVIGTAFDVMRDYRRLRFSDEDLLQKAAYFEFYLEIATQGAAQGFTRTYALFVDNQLAGAALGLVHNKQLLVVLSGFDLNGFKKYSIGSLVFQEIAKDALERGDLCLDFTIGDEPYKRLFGAQPTRMWTTTSSGSALGMVAGFVLKQVPWAKTVAKRFVRPVTAPAAASVAN